MAQPELNQHFRDFLNLLNQNRVEYLVIGGYAVGYHGYSRPTGDIDVWISRNPANVARLMDAVRMFGFDVPELRADVIEQQRKTLRMGISPFRIEVFPQILGVDFEEAYARRLEVELDGLPVKMITRADLIANKKATGRAKDIADLQNLVE